MKIVKFFDGTYGVQKGWWSKEYFDVKHHEFWWGRPHQVYKYCRVDTLEEAIKLMNIAKISHKVCAC